MTWCSIGYILDGCHGKQTIPLPYMEPSVISILHKRVLWPSFKIWDLESSYPLLAATGQQSTRRAGFTILGCPDRYPSGCRGNPSVMHGLPKTYLFPSPHLCNFPPSHFPIPPGGPRLPPLSSFPITLPIPRAHQPTFVGSEPGKD